MFKLVIAIVFGGVSPEHNESIRAGQTFYKRAIRKGLYHHYAFEYFYISSGGRWASNRDSKNILRKKVENRIEYSTERILDLTAVDSIYNLMMGVSGENGNIMGLADLLNISMIGCGITQSAISSDKRLTKKLVSTLNIPIVESVTVWKSQQMTDIIEDVEENIGYPCIVKPTNLGTCNYTFLVNSRSEFIEKWVDTVHVNRFSNVYLVEKYLPNIEVRVFIFEDNRNRLHMNDEYVTKLKKGVLNTGGYLFNHLQNNLPRDVRRMIKEYTESIFREFQLKDYARIDFFVTSDMQIYFNEINTHPFIGNYNVKLLERDGITFRDWFIMMVNKNRD